MVWIGPCVGPKYLKTGILEFSMQLIRWPPISCHDLVLEGLDAGAVEEPHDDVAAGFDAAGKFPQDRANVLGLRVDDRIPRQYAGHGSIRHPQIVQVAHPEGHPGEPLPRTFDECRNQVDALDVGAAFMEQRGPLAGTATGVNDGTIRMSRQAQDQLAIVWMRVNHGSHCRDVFIGALGVGLNNPGSGHGVESR